MHWLQLDPASIAARALEARSTIPTPGASILRGVVGFTVVSVAGFAPWALAGRWLRGHVGEVGLYVACALVFIGLSGPALHRLIIGPGSLKRFYELFAVAFTSYSIAWIVGWMTMRGHLGSTVGLLAGTIVTGEILGRAFEAWEQRWKMMAALFVLNAVGYFVGGVIEGALIREHALAAKLLWGVSYGVGLGAGLGVAFYLAQEEARARIARKRASAE
jgi:hypothetical protein